MEKVSVEQPLACEYPWGESYCGHTLHTLSISTRGSEEKAKSFSSEPHHGDEDMAISPRVSGKGPPAHVNNTHSLRTSYTQGSPQRFLFVFPKSQHIPVSQAYSYFDLFFLIFPILTQDSLC